MSRMYRVVLSSTTDMQETVRKGRRDVADRKRLIEQNQRKMTEIESRTAQAKERLRNMDNGIHIIRYVRT